MIIVVSGNCLSLVKNWGIGYIGIDIGYFGVKVITVFPIKTRSSLNVNRDEIINDFIG